MGSQSCFNFSQFDSKSPNFHLPVITLCKLHRPIGEITSQVSGPVDTLTICSRKRTRQKFDRGKMWILHISTRQMWAADENFSQLSDAGQLLRLVQHQKLNILDTATKRYCVF